jgi:hypothetical protein
MDQASEYVKQNSGMLGTVVFIAIAMAILYVVYTYLYPADDPTYVQLLKGEADARKHVPVKGKVPAIFTGGDFTLSFWVYIDDWNYKVSASKFLFALSPEQLGLASKSPLVAVLTPYQNGLQVRANTTASAKAPPPGPVAAVTSAAGPDITIESNLQTLLNQQTSMSMFQSTVDVPCDMKEVPLQRWVCLTIVSSGRVLDIYMDGKLARSCVLENNIQIPRGPLRLRLGENGGFGGRYSSVQMWNQQLTPDVIYGIYMMGPTQAQHNVFTDVAKYFNLNVSFTGSAPGQPIPGQAPPTNPFSQLYGEARSDATSVYSDASGDVKSMMSRF